MNKRKKPVWLLILADLGALAACLMVFALFHHVIPMRGTALGLAAGAAQALAEDADGTETPPLALAADVEEADVTLSEHAYLGGSVLYYLADLRLPDVRALRTAFARDAYGSGFTETVSDMDLRLDALLCVNGDYYGNSASGVVVRNGVVYRAGRTDSDVLCLYGDGRMEVKAWSAFDAAAETRLGIWQAWTFGPSLLDGDGRAIDSFSEGRHMNGRNPRTVLGYYGPGHYAVLVVDGRGASAGLSLTELSALCEELGFRLAYNLDGGKSSVLTYGDRVVNQPASGGRSVSDVIYIPEDAV